MRDIVETEKYLILKIRQQLILIVSFGMTDASRIAPCYCARGSDRIKKKQFLIECNSVHTLLRSFSVPDGAATFAVLARVISRYFE